MPQNISYPVSEPFKHAWMTEEKYQSLYRHSLENPESFWAYKAEQYLSWYKPWESVYEGDFKTGSVNWFKGG